MLAIQCPECGSTRWKKHGTVSCSIVPFEAECAQCGHCPDVLTNRRLCPQKEFVFHDKDWNTVRHLVCYECGTEELEFDMVNEISTPDKTVEFGDWPNESMWTLPGEWVKMNIDTEDFDGNPIIEIILFCSMVCKNRYRRGYSVC